MIAIKRLLSGLGIAALSLLVVFDSKFHFDQELIKKKHQRYSAQRHWNLFYTQAPVFKHSSIRYQDELAKLKKIIRPGSVVLSDLASSYYLASQLPVYVRNLHPHHRGSISGEWRNLIKERYACYLEFEKNQQRLAEFLQKGERFDYWLVNKDGLNRHLKMDCLARRSGGVRSNLSNLARRKWSGANFDLFDFSESIAPHVEKQ